MQRYPICDKTPHHLDVETITMDDSVGLPTSLLDDHDFIVTMCRYAEGTITENYIRKKYRFDDATWEKLGSDDLICERIEDERIRRERSGQAKRELAQKHVVKAPDILNSIMSDANANNRHRVDAIKTLDELAANAPQTVPAAAAAERFQIIINLGNDEVVKFDKTITPRPRNIDNELLLTSKREDDSSNIDNADQLPTGLLAANKQGNDGNGGQPI
jgi:hypothetical protein